MLSWSTQSWLRCKSQWSPEEGYTRKALRINTVTNTGIYHRCQWSTCSFNQPHTGGKLAPHMNLLSSPASPVPTRGQCPRPSCPQKACSGHVSSSSWSIQCPPRSKRKRTKSWDYTHTHTHTLSLSLTLSLTGQNTSKITMIKFCLAYSLSPFPNTTKPKFSVTPWVSS